MAKADFLCQKLHIGKNEGAIYKALKGYSDFGEKLFNEYMTEYTKSYAGRR